ncbi:MAG: hypothetical protein BGO26_03750 [Actinobacteria bacterium 69-20]|nr:beta-galactosidase [Actinomycetota bacterium]OJV23932.1 MAG: hypothetical protein BGO26_03750 [Actinobacteria bacterium 69-20]
MNLAPSTVELRGGLLLIDGTPRIVLAASVFPFRIDRGSWASRIAQVRGLGYDAVDLYVPWNAHEQRAGDFDFNGDRDIAHFLDLCADAGLLVVARPGPYICSEWDGGGLPARLALVPGLRVRQNEPRYLAEVERWFDAILPILAPRQSTAGGPVALVQLENELDFFDCDDPAGYLEFLRDAARGHGITVPLIACAGQGDLARASGGVDGVAPAPNLYPDDDSVDIEAHAAYYERAARDAGLPLLVPETNRRHRTLKRLVVAGARLLGPYLQTSGWNPGGGTAVNNWGDPLAFLTHDYDFGGAIAADGTERPEAAEARRLAATIAALGARLAAGTPRGDARDVDADLTVAPQAISLDGGGELIAVTQLAPMDAVVRVRAGMRQVDARIPAGACLLLPREVPIADAAVLLLSTGELVRLETADGAMILGVTAERSSRLLIEADALGTEIDGDAAALIEDGIVEIAGTDAVVSVRLATRTLTVVLSTWARPKTPEPVSVALVDVVATEPLDEPAAWRDVQAAGPAGPLESWGDGRGAARYRSRVSVPEGALGLIVEGGADVISVRRGKTGWFAPGGADVFVPVDAGDPIDIRTLTWGHSNFDDPRLPALRLGSTRGIRGASVVTRIVPFSEGWIVAESDGSAVGSHPAPRGWLGGWMTAVSPQRIRYERVVAAHELGYAALRVRGGGCRIDVDIDGDRRGVLTPLIGIVTLGNLDAGAVVSLTVHRTWGEPVGDLELLLGAAIADWRISVQGHDELVAAAQAPHPRETIALPVPVPAGTARWVDVPIPEGEADLTIELAGTGFLATAVMGDLVLGRVWSEGPDGVSLRGGRSDILVVPPRLRRDVLRLLVQATTTDAAMLEKLVLWSGGGERP